MQGSVRHGALVSIINSEFFSSPFPNEKSGKLVKLLSGQFKINAANGTVIPYTGWVELAFRFLPSSGNETEMTIPFLVQSFCETWQYCDEWQKCT